MDGLRERLVGVEWPPGWRGVLGWARTHAFALLVIALFLPTAHAMVQPLSLGLGPGTVAEPADNATYVSIQGFHFEGQDNEKKPARLVAANGDATTRWRFDGEAVDAFWFYDVDPLANGNLLVSTTRPNGTTVMEFDPDSREAVWTEDFAINDTHDVAMMPDGRLLVANMREYEDGVSNDRLFVYDREDESVDWEWRFRDHYANDTNGGFTEDWTHVNDVDVLDDEGRYVLTSPRNFDQSIVVDRETDEVVMRLGEDGDHDVLYEQHNPDYFERDDGTPVMLVADSENDRVIEYERDCGDADPSLGAGTPPEDCTWGHVWSVDGFNWPRDADRLPDGNTLVTDSLNHRVVEITPEGEVVWEFHASWGPYDAERGEPGSNGPAMSAVGTEGTYEVSGGDEDSPAGRYTVPDALDDVGAAIPPISGVTDWLSRRYAHVEPWLRPVWMSSWAALSTAIGGLLAVGWGLNRAVTRREWIVSRARSLLPER